MSGSEDELASTTEQNMVSFDINVWQLLLRQAPEPVRLFLLGIGSLSAGSVAALIQFADDPVGFVFEIIELYIIETIILPVATGIWQFGLDVIATINAIFGFIQSIPFAITDPIVGTVTTITGRAIGGITAFNHELARGLETAGIAAPTIATAIAAIELAGIAYLLWIAISTIDLPIVDQRGWFLAVTRPIRNLFEVFR